MRKFLNILAIVIILFAVGCKKDDKVTPVVPPSEEQVAFINNTMITSTVEGEDIMNFSVKNNQFNVSDNLYKLIDNFGFISTSYALSAEPVIDTELSLTYGVYEVGEVEPSQETTYEALRVVEIKNGFVYLWNEENQLGFILPEIVDLENL